MRAYSNFRPRIVSLEEAYFTEKDRELIQKLRESQDSQADDMNSVEDSRSSTPTSQELSLIEFKKSA